MTDMEGTREDVAEMEGMRERPWQRWKVGEAVAEMEGGRERP